MKACTKQAYRDQAPARLALKSVLEKASRDRQSCRAASIRATSATGGTSRLRSCQARRHRGIWIRTGRALARPAPDSDFRVLGDGSGCATARNRLPVIAPRGSRAGYRLEHVPPMNEPLPVFAYYPGAAQDGRVHESDARCTACDRRRGWISDALLYSASKPDDAYFCPWCIADGAAVRRFGGSFNELDEMSTDRDAAIVVSQRTPNFLTWQDWFWPTHCGLPAIYHGQPSGNELRTNAGALAALLSHLREYEWGRDEAYVAGLIDGLGGSHVAYLFECGVCESPIVCWDAD